MFRRKLKKFLHTSNIEYTRDWRIPGTVFIVDYYLPEYNLAIDYLGMLHPSEEYLRIILYMRRQFIKVRLCKEKRISLIETCQAENDYFCTKLVETLHLIKALGYIQEIINPFQGV